MLLDSEEATARLGRAIATQLRIGDVIGLSGELGAGKTSLARGILRGLGFEGDAPSPTFAIVQPYEELDVPIWHVDLYRIEDPTEIEQIGLDEGREVAALLIEWPERLAEGLWTDALWLGLERRTENVRALTARVPAAWDTRWPPR